MRAPTTTRRSLLVAAAGGLAGGVIRSRPALAALATAPPQPRVSSRPLGSLARGRLLGVSLGAPADLIGVSWRGEPHARVEMRLREASGRFGAWVAAGARGHAPEGPARGSETIGDPVWTGGTSELQLRSDRPLERVRLHLVDVSGGIGARVRARRIALLATPLALATPALAAGAGQPPIIARRAWAHRAAPPKVAPEYGAVRLAFVHHTENPNGYGRGEVPSMLLAIYAFHRYVRGWDDIGYNFVIDRFGRIFEARAGGIDEPVSGAQAGGYNLESTGVAVLGSFQSVPISAHARNALQRLLAWKLSLHGVPAHGSVTVRVNPAGAVFSRFPAGAHVPLPRIAGHRDGDSTDCPGDALYGELPQIRRAVRRLAPTQARLTLLASAPAPAPPVPPAGAGPSVPPAPGSLPPTLSGRLALLDGTPLASVRILVQARSVRREGEVVEERTLGEALTDASGAWSLPASFALPAPRKLWLRALFLGAGAHGACVSDPLQVEVDAAVAPSAQARAPTPAGARPPAP
jgi:N-acetylmuramoyl-L-alanine amidase